jgi:CheY-like chemotaxis protein
MIGVCALRRNGKLFAASKRKDNLPSAANPLLLFASRAAVVPVAMSDTKTNHSEPAKGAGALIYVVDDEPMLLELASVILEPHGYRIRTFRDPEAALQSFAAARPRPDLLITDYAMHSMNGMQLIKKFRALEPCQKIILVSGTVGEDIFRNETARPDRFLSKPYQADQLASHVETLLAGK